MNGDLLGYVALRATRRFGGSDGTFNAAGFSAAWQDVTGLRAGLDGRAVEAMLWGRADVERLGGSHYRAAGGGTMSKTGTLSHNHPGDDNWLGCPVCHQADQERAERAEVELAELREQMAHKHLDVCPLAQEAARGAAERAERQAEALAKAVEAALIQTRIPNPVTLGLALFHVDRIANICTAAVSAYREGR